MISRASTPFIDVDFSGTGGHVALSAVLQSAAAWRLVQTVHAGRHPCALYGGGPSHSQCDWEAGAWPRGESHATHDRERVFTGHYDGRKVECGGDVRAGISKSTVLVVSVEGRS